MPEKRQLAAIMFTDIVGYTKMMGEDENAALSVLRKNRDVHKKMIPEYHGPFRASKES
jgi:class 3 adenylate cyclase